MRYFFLLSCATLLVGCSKDGPRKDSVILECKGTSHYDGGPLATYPVQSETNTYRINGDTGSFETWDGEAFHGWNDKITMDDVFYHYASEKPGNNLGKREVWFERKSGKVTDTVANVDGGEKYNSIFDGMCEPVDAPKADPRKF